MLVERSPVARMECDHGHRDRIALVLEKQRQVVRFDIPQLDLCLHQGLLHSVNFGIIKKETPGVPKIMHRKPVTAAAATAALAEEATMHASPYEL